VKKLNKMYKVFTSS